MSVSSCSCALSRKMMSGVRPLALSQRAPMVLVAWKGMMCCRPSVRFVANLASRALGLLHEVCPSSIAFSARAELRAQYAAPRSENGKLDTQ